MERIRFDENIMDYGDIITIEPGKRSGKPCIRGMRITVYDILEYLAGGMTEAEVLEDFSELTSQDIKACLAFAADREKKLFVASWVRLLLDENLSDGIVRRIIDLYPDSAHVKILTLTNTDDSIIWEYAHANNFVIVSKDSDFHQRSLLYGHPPKFIYLRIGNSPTSKIVQILRDNFDIIIQFWNSEVESILVLA